jgi:hypothetical protein
MDADYIELNTCGESYPLFSPKQLHLRDVVTGVGCLPEAILELLSDGPKKEMRLADYTYYLEQGLVRDHAPKSKTPKHG